MYLSYHEIHPKFRNDFENSPMGNVPFAGKLRLIDLATAHGRAPV